MSNYITRKHKLHLEFLYCSASFVLAESPLPRINQTKNVENKEIPIHVFPTDIFWSLNLFFFFVSLKEIKGQSECMFLTYIFCHLIDENLLWETIHASYYQMIDINIVIIKNHINQIFP